MTDDSLPRKRPGPRRRLAVALLVGLLSELLVFFRHLQDPHGHFDFGLVWFQARSLLNGVDPYPLVGPGLVYDQPWPLLYPASAGVAAIPLALLPELAATFVFVGLSAILVTYGLTRDGWNRLWILPSSSFVIAVMAGQWSPLFCAALLIPQMSWVLSAKPSLGLAILAGSRSRIAFAYAAAGAIILVAISLALVPTWVQSWLVAVRTHAHEVAPVATWPGGVLALLALLRWRRAESWLVVAMTIVPLTPGWYEVLPLLLIPRTKRECQVLSLLASAGYLLQGALLLPDGTVPIGVTRSLIVAFGYLPAVIVLLRRPNESGIPGYPLARV